jgi:hypothetical protein
MAYLEIIHWTGIARAFQLSPYLRRQGAAREFIHWYRRSSLTIPGVTVRKPRSPAIFVMTPKLCRPTRPARNCAAMCPFAMAWSPNGALA